MQELLRFINVSCKTPKYNLNYFSFVLGRGELLAISSDMTSTKDALIALLTKQTQPTSGRIDWNAGGLPSCLISYESRLLYKDLSIAENFTLTKFSSFRVFYPRQRSLDAADDMLKAFGINLNVSAPVYSLPKIQQYILSILKAVYLGAEYLILSDVVRLHYTDDLDLLICLISELLQRGISIILTDSYQNPLFNCSPIYKILRFERGTLVRILNGQQEQRSFDNYHPSPQILSQDIIPKKGSFNPKVFPSVIISAIHTQNIRSLSLHLQPGEITYLIGRGLYEHEFIDSLFGQNPTFSIQWGSKFYSNLGREQLFRVGVGYFPQDVNSLIFPDLNYVDNYSILLLKKISCLRLFIRYPLLNYLLKQSLIPYREETSKPFYSINYENRIITAANRYNAYNWRLLVVHLPNINPSSLEAKVIQEMIYSLARQGTCLLIVAAADTEILTRADAQVEFDTDGNCYYIDN